VRSQHGELPGARALDDIEAGRVLFEVARQAQRFVDVVACDRPAVRGRGGWVNRQRPPDHAVDGDVDQAGGVDDPRRRTASDVNTPSCPEGGDQAISLHGAEQRR